MLYNMACISLFLLLRCYLMGPKQNWSICGANTLLGISKEIKIIKGGEKEIGKIMNAAVFVYIENNCFFFYCHS